MPGVITGLIVLYLHCWWCVRTTNSAAVKRSWPYPRQLKVNADLYRRPRGWRGRHHARLRTKHQSLEA